MSNGLACTLTCSLRLLGTGIDEVENGKDAVARQLGLILKSKSSSTMTETDGLSKRTSKPDNMSWKIAKKKLREDEKQEKRRVKEEERVRRQNEKKNKKKSGKSAGIDDFAQSDQNAVPLFVEKCITFIQEEGLDLEGLYRVPGNRAHVDLLFQKFDEGQSPLISLCPIFCCSSGWPSRCPRIPFPRLSLPFSLSSSRVASTFACKLIPRAGTQFSCPFSLFPRSSTRPQRLDQAAGHSSERSGDGTQRLLLQATSTTASA